MSQFATIDERRRILDLSQKDLCQKAGIAPSTYVRIKRQHTSPLERTLLRLDQALQSIADERSAA